MNWTKVFPLWAAVLLAVLALSPRRAAAQNNPDLERALGNLRHEDFRVRTQAALALGTTKDARALAALCRGLGDPSVPVRAAAAAALGRLAQQGGLACLEQRYSLESDAKVRLAIQRSVELVYTGFRITDATRVYVAIAALADQSGRTSVDLPRLALTTMLTAGKSFPELAFAPVWEDTPLAKRRLEGHPRVKAFYLSPRLPAFEYSSGNLVVRLEVALFSYPEKALLGNFNVKLTQPDVEREDRESELDLVKTAAERAIQKFARLVPTL